MAKETEFSDPMRERQVAHRPQSLALILCDDPYTDLDTLTAQRCKAALPFAGKYRAIDFSLSNCVNSGIETVGVITQHQPRSLDAHLAWGRPWDLDRSETGLTLLHPYQTDAGIGWYRGTADALYRNQDYIHHYRADEVFVLAGGEVCSIDLSALAARHRVAKADLTVATVATWERAASAHGTLAVDREGWVHAWISPESDAPSPLAVMGVALFSTDVLAWRLSEDAGRSASTHDLIRDVIAHMVHAGDRVMAFPHRGYWNSLRTVQGYWQAHMDLVNEGPVLNLAEQHWPIRTRLEARPAARVSMRAEVSRGILSEGSVVEGVVEHSVLSPGVYVAPSAVVRNAVVLHDVAIKEGALVENAILDMNVTVGPQARVGWSDRQVSTWGGSQPRRIAVVEQGAYILGHAVIEPDGLRLQRPLFAHPTDVSEAQVNAVR
jgi:glucose-1-phosphate adenylyltransferase